MDWFSIQYYISQNGVNNFIVKYFMEDKLTLLHIIIIINYKILHEVQI